MPCYSATNLRFTKAQQQQANKERALTALRRDDALLYKGRSYRKAKKQEPPALKECPPLMRSSESVIKEIPPRRNLVRMRPVPVSSQQTVLGPKDLERLHQAARIITADDRLDELMRQEAEVRRLEDDADRTRNNFRIVDEARKRAVDATTEKEDLTGATEKLVVLERSFLAKHEQEEEVKRVNRIILNAKCHAVRDAQLAEKADYTRMAKGENLRIEKMVLERAVEALNEEDKKHEDMQLVKREYARAIRAQLTEREQMRFVAAERIEDEAKQMRNLADAIKRDEERRRISERHRRNTFRDELKRISEMSLVFKKMLCEQEREAEMRVAAYQREKEARERQLRVEKQAEKEAHERKQERIFALAQKILDSKSQREEMSYMKECERIEREYRRKEKEAVLRKRQIEIDMADARERQLNETKHRQALQIARAEKDFNLLVKSTTSDQAKQKQQDVEREERRRCYRTDIIRQMTDKELERRRLEELDRKMAFDSRERERQREANIAAVINAKLAAMRDACLPEKYILDVEAQLRKINNRLRPKE